MATTPSNPVISPTRISLPAEVDWYRWCVIAADQFTSSPTYWQQAAQLVGDHPSTLNLIVPEVFLSLEDGAALTARIDRVHRTMRDYSTQHLRETPAGVIYVERTTGEGRLRRSLVAALDLESYDFAANPRSNGATAQVRASEATILERIPARAAVRRGAALETPHVQVLFDDPEDRIFTALTPTRNLGAPLYDTDLMAGGGHLTGWFIPAEGESWARASELLGSLDNRRGFRFLVGDGNHSLAAAKSHWQRLRADGAPAAHPARWALVELVNIHDPGIIFEPIHRVVKAVPWVAVNESIADWNHRHRTYQRTRLTCLTPQGNREVEIAQPTALIVETVDQVIAAVLASLQLDAAKTVDYIHGRRELERLVDTESAVAWLIPKLDRSALFDYVSKYGPMPKKSFSLGHAEDKRYYCECRRLEP